MNTFNRLIANPKPTGCECPISWPHTWQRQHSSCAIGAGADWETLTGPFLDTVLAQNTLAIIYPSLQLLNGCH
jgi:hypothetical protein